MSIQYFKNESIIGCPHKLILVFDFMVSGSTSVAIPLSKYSIYINLVSISPVVTVDAVGDTEGIVVGGIIILHTTWEGSGLHVPFSSHTESGGVAASPGRHW